MKKTLIIVASLFLTLILSDSIKAQNINDSNKTVATIQKADYDQNIEIKKKPRPSFPRTCSLSSGITRVRATFDKSAKVTNAELVSSSGCKSFDGNSIKAAYKIKFSPAEKDGQPITVVKVVEFAFSIY